jgi:hypothetical protein
MQDDLFPPAPIVPLAPLTPLAPFAPHEHVRTTDPGTSWAAANSLVDVTVVQQRVYALHWLHPGGLTDEELLRLYVAKHGVTAESTPRKRRCDLTHMGIIEDTGLRRVLSSTRMGIVWGIRS